jgi:predicted alpha/beta hydrolase family esterase
MSIDSFYYRDEELEGAKIRVAIPKGNKFNGNVIIFCHGCRPVGIPLIADLFCENDALYLQLLQEGWIIGMTSYSKQGLTIREAIEDVDLLRDWICLNCGLLDPITQQRKLNLVILEGHSMGGAIVTHIAERADTSRYSGIMAVGAALLVREHDENGQVLQFNHQPKLPMIYLTNSDETHVIEEYIENARENDCSVLPSLFIVYRNGHDNVNDEERIKTFNGLTEWIKSGTCLPLNDVTTIIQPKSNNDIFFDDEGIWGKGKHLTKLVAYFVSISNRFMG